MIECVKNKYIKNNIISENLWSQGTPKRLRDKGLAARAFVGEQPRADFPAKIDGTGTLPTLAVGRRARITFQKK